MKTRKEAEARAMELFPDPNHDTHWERERVKFLRQAFIKCWHEMQQNKQTCGFCVEPKNEEND